MCYGNENRILDEGDNEKCVRVRRLCIGNMVYIFINLYILFAITAAGVVPCGGRKKSPRTSSIVQIIFLFRSFEISKNIQSVQNTHV